MTSQLLATICLVNDELLLGLALLLLGDGDGSGNLLAARFVEVARAAGALDRDSENEGERQGDGEPCRPLQAVHVLPAGVSAAISSRAYDFSEASGARHDNKEDRRRRPGRPQP
jgi:hypothetical protein